MPFFVQKLLNAQRGVGRTRHLFATAWDVSSTNHESAFSKLLGKNFG